MDKKTETLKLALEEAYLAGFNASGEGYNGEYPFQDHNAPPERDAHWCKGRDYYVREALAEQCVCGEPDTPGTHRTDGPCLAEQPAQQEPVAWMWRCKPYCNWPEWSVSLKRPADSGCDGHKRTEGYEDVPLYTSPPASKPWVGLDQHDIDVLFLNEDGVRFARYIEAKLREKNT